MSTAGEVVADCLEALGVKRCFGGALPRLHHVDVPDPDLAVLLADADGRLGALGAALVPGQVLHVSSQPGGTAYPLTVHSIDEAVAALDTRAGIEVPATYALHLDFDLDAPAPEGLEPGRGIDPDVLVTLSPTFADMRLLVLAGPGVLRGGHVGGLATFAKRSGSGVLNTWGAKGVLRFDDPHHFGTIGLQEGDWPMAGLDDAEVIIATGLDLAEAPVDRWAHHVVQEVDPWQLATLTHNWPDPAPGRQLPPRPPLFSRLFEALSGSGAYESGAVPFLPARVCAAVGRQLPSGGVIAADPGPAGFWVARAFPTLEPGSVVVPSGAADGFAAAATLVSGLDGRPCVGITHELSALSAEVLELAEALGLPAHLQVWGDGRMADADALEAATADALSSGTVDVYDVPVDWSPGSELVAAAGPVVAWPGLDLAAWGLR